MEFDYIVDHAIKNVWCTPRQDRQVIIKPARLTARHGSFKNFRLMWREAPLPDQINRWHVYQIGGTHPLAFNLFARCYTWVKLSDACNSQSMIADVYTANGYKFPLFETYYSYTADHNLILAVKINKTLPMLPDIEDIFIRIYSNAYFDSPRSDSLTTNVSVVGRYIDSVTTRNSFKTQFNSARSNPGYTWLYVNGVMYQNWVDALIPVGSYAEFVYDGSVKKVIQLNIKDLATFESTLDSKLKYLLHYQGVSDNTIDYQDDIDVYIAKQHTTAGFQALYYNKNNEDAMRNLTHRDYSICSTYVKRYSDAFEIQTVPRGYVDPQDLTAFLFIRNSGYNRALVYENSRIHELYKMQDLDIQRAMTGIDATVDVWKAANLEQAAYPLVMRSKCCDITNQLVEDAYGYNAVSKLLADTPSVPFDNNGEIGVKVPYELQFGCTAYEYGSDGLLINFYHHYVGSFYKTQNLTTHYVELIAGLGGPILDEFKGITDMQLSDRYTYRVFQCTAIAGVPDNKWIDVTGEDKYTMTDTSFEWTNTSVTAYPMIRSDKRFIARDYELSMTDGALEFTLQQKVNTASGLAEQIMQVPMGQMDVFMNGRSLIRDLDYFVSFPKVYIVNKKYLKRPIISEKQKIHVRFTGFASKNLELVDDSNRGFVEHGLLSNDSKYNIRDDKVLRITVDGQLYTRDELIFSEFTSGVSITDPLNGAPYMVKDILVPVSAFTTSDTYDLRAKSAVIDKAVSEYLTLKIPQPDRPAPSAVTQRYQLYSPFCNKLIMDLKYGRLVLPTQSTPYTRQQVLEICKPYEKLLTVDPSQAVRKQDERYVVIHPHGQDNVMDLPQTQYQFMYQAISYYTNGLVELSQLVRMV